MTMRRAFVGALLASAMVPASATGQGAITPEAKNFGLRDDVSDVAISPDGKLLAIVAPNGARGSAVLVVPTDGSAAPKGVLAYNGSPDRIARCSFGSATRLVCTVYSIRNVFGENSGGTRLVAVDADGKNASILSAPNSDQAYGVALGGGNIIDYSAGAKPGVLMSRYFVPQSTTGSFTSSGRSGLGVDRVDLSSMSHVTVEQPSDGAVGYLSDGQGNVRIMAVGRTSNLDQSTGGMSFRYRKKGSRDWLPLAEAKFSNYQTTGFEPQAVDPELDVAYGIENVDGRTGLYSVALDGSLKKTLVFSAPAGSFGVDNLIQIGRQQRVVGASWTTDRRHAQMFDPELKRFTDALARTLPNAPDVSIVDASADEQKLVVFAGSDTDPGRFYVYDKAARKLSEILPVRAALAGTKLSPMRAISYPAADGTRIPAYLTLPVGAASAKGLPAIVLPHGGPSYRDQWSFDWLPQFFAARGYAVIQPQYRGSTGYGSEFFGKNAIRGWKQAIDDVDDAGRWLVKEGIADPAKLAIVGWSYGGFAALQSQVVAPDLFKAVVAIAPVTDWTQMRRDMDKESGTTKEQIDAMFGTDAKLLADGSPALHADRFAAPVLMYMGDLDQNVPIEQGRLMNSKLKGAGKQVRYVEEKGLDHQLDDSVVRQDMLADADAFLRLAMKM